jgi:hypothetical protein
MSEIVADRLYTKNQTAELEGIRLTLLFLRMRRGEYEVVNDGSRNPKITGRSILKRREAHLRPAVYGRRAGIRGVPSKADRATTKRRRGRRIKAATAQPQTAAPTG